MGRHGILISQSGREAEEEGWGHRKVMDIHCRKESQGALDLKTYVDGYTGWENRATLSQNRAGAGSHASVTETESPGNMHKSKLGVPGPMSNGLRGN